MSVSGGGGPEEGRGGTWIVLLVAVLLRAPFLGGAHGIDDDEFYSLRNSENLLATPTPAAVKAWPVTFAASRAVTEVCGLSPFSLRLLPFLCGVLAPLLLFRIGRRFVGPRAALLAALLLAVWPWHQYYSGLARYYAPLFLFSLLVLDRLDRLLTGPRRGDAAAFVLWLVLAMATHSTGILAVGGAVVALRSARRLRRGAVLLMFGAVVALAATVFLVPSLSGPILHVISGAGGHGYDAVHFAMSLAMNVTPLVGLLAIAGAVTLVARRGERSAFLVASAAAPVAALVGLVLVGGVEVQARYAMAGMPAVLLLAGAGAARLLGPLFDAGRLPRLAAAGVLVVPLLPGAASNLIDGNRHDVAGAARRLAEDLDAETIVFAEGHSLYVMELWGLDRRLPPGEGDPPFPRELEESPPTEEQLRAVARHRGGTRFALPDNVFETLPERGEASYQAWLRERTVVVDRIGRRRLDYPRNVITIYRTREEDGT